MKSEELFSVKKIIFLILFVSSILSVNGQSITVKAPQQVACGENFRLSYVVNTQDVSGFRAGNVPAGLEIIAGPYTSSQSSFQMVNGHTTSSSSITYTYTLYAEKNGTYTIGPAKATVGGKQVQSQAIKITVSGSQSSRQGQPRMHGDDDSGMRQAGTRITGNDLYIRVSANKKRVHEQEPILLTYKVYTQVDLSQLSGKMPDLKGFHTQEIPLPQQKSFSVEYIDGRPFRTVTWSQYVMFPQMTGKMEIPSITFKGVVVQRNPNVDPFEAFFNGGSGFIEVKRDVVAPAVQIQVDPLPERPAGFSGGVGSFKISASADKKQVKAGEPITIRVTIDGCGNLKLIKQPQLQLPKDFDKYDPKSTDKTKITANGLEGSMIYDYLVVPRNQGKYTIPAIEFTYFDVNTNAYKTLKTEPIELDVLKGDGKHTVVADFSDSDIHDIKKGNSDLQQTDNYLISSGTFKLMLLLPLLVFGVLVYIFRKRAQRNANVVLLKGLKANKVATKRLKKAAKLMSKNLQNEFYDEVLRALWGYVGDKLNIPVSELSRDNICERLEERNINNSIIDSFIAAIDECEYARFAPGDPKGKMDIVYEKAATAITEINEGLRRP